MTRENTDAQKTRMALEMLGLERPGDDAALDGRVVHLQSLRGASTNMSVELDRALVRRVATLHAGLSQARENQQALEEMLERMTAPPLHPALFLGATTSQGRPAALVSHGDQQRVVLPSGDVALEDLGVGDVVLLSNELNVLVERASCPSLLCGETAVFDRLTDDGRMIVKCRDEELVGLPASALVDEPPEAGDLIRFDRQSWLGFEKLEATSETGLHMVENPDATFDDIGGLDEEIERLKRVFLLALRHGDVMESYGVAPEGAVLLVGQPGNGKTLMAKALVNWLSRHTESGLARFLNVKPGSWGSMWYSETERNIRETFRIAREIGARDPRVPVVLFLDEVDSIASARGASLSRVDDRVKQALMVELDGMDRRGNVLVVAATNRLDALDTAFVRKGRLGDCVIDIPRPDRRGADAVLRKYLTEALPYAVGRGTDARAARQEVVDVALSAIYSPNAAEDLATIKFRDGSRRIVRPHDLVSGAMLAKIANEACKAAAYRQISTGTVGLRSDDVLEAIAAEFPVAARALTPLNCHRYLDDLSRDVEVLAVDPVPSSPLTHRYLAAAS